MQQTELAAFTIRIFSTDNATWQGQAESAGEVFAFKSEMQLLKWLCEKHPALAPDPQPEVFSV